MDFSSLSDLFGTWVRGRSKVRAVVNYIWIPDCDHNNYLSEDPDSPLSQLELSRFDRLIANANKYPNADFQLWVDMNRLDDMSRFWLASVMYADGRHKNISIRDLNEIPAYANDQYFRLPRNMDFSRVGVILRADYSRIVVLGACGNDPANAGRPIIYSDLDCRDLQLPRVLSRIAKYGAAINLLKDSFVVSHGFIGLDFTRESVRRNFPKLMTDTREDVMATETGDGAFDKFLGRIGLSKGARRDKQIGLYLLPPIGTQVSVNPVYGKLGVN